MKAQTKNTKSLNWRQQIKQIEKEIKPLKDQLLTPHFTKSAEHDYDIKSQIIDKQNQIIEILIKQTNKNIKK